MDGRVARAKIKFPASAENGFCGEMPLGDVDRVEQEIEALYEEAFGRLRRGVVTLVGSWEEAADVVQESFAQAWASRRTYRGDGTLEAWVWRIALRIAARRASRAGDTLEVQFDVLDPTLTVGASNRTELAEAFAELPPQRRLIVLLRFVGGLSYQEIAATTGLTEGTVAGALSKARRQLIRSLEAKGVRP
jgi:RNA polymerase sigma-70 factor (ECF subfamily)